MANKKLSDIRNIDELAVMFGLPDYESIESRNEEYIFDATRGIRDEMEQDEDVTEEQIEEAEMKAQQEAGDELYRNWHDAVEHVAEELFDDHGLNLVPRKASERMPYEYKIVPTESWEQAASKILDTINGVGEFEFASLREFLDSGPYTPRQAVLSHLGYIKRRPDVYGESSPKARFESAWR